MHLPVLSRAMPSLLSLLTSSSLSLKTPLKCPCPCGVIPESGWGPFSLHPVFLHGLSSGEHLGAGLDFSTLATAPKPHHGGSYWSTSLSLLEISVNCQYKDYFFARKTELFCYFGAPSTWKLELGFWEKGEHDGSQRTREWRSSIADDI